MEAHQEFGLQPFVELRLIDASKRQIPLQVLVTIVITLKDIVEIDGNILSLYRTKGNQIVRRST